MFPLSRVSEKRNRGYFSSSCLEPTLLPFHLGQDLLINGMNPRSTEAEHQVTDRSKGIPWVVRELGSGLFPMPSSDNYGKKSLVFANVILNRRSHIDMVCTMGRHLARVKRRAKDLQKGSSLALEMG